MPPKKPSNLRASMAARAAAKQPSIKHEDGKTGDESVAVEHGEAQNQQAAPAPEAEQTPVQDQQSQESPASTPSGSKKPMPSNAGAPVADAAPQKDQSNELEQHQQEQPVTILTGSKQSARQSHADGLPLAGTAAPEGQNPEDGQPPLVEHKDGPPPGEAAQEGQPEQEKLAPSPTGNKKSGRESHAGAPSAIAVRSGPSNEGSKGEQAEETANAPSHDGQPAKVGASKSIKAKQGVSSAASAAAKDTPPPNETPSKGKQATPASEQPAATAPQDRPQQAGAGMLHGIDEAKVAKVQAVQRKRMAQREVQQMRAQKQQQEEQQQQWQQEQQPPYQQAPDEPLPAAYFPQDGGEYGQPNASDPFQQLSGAPIDPSFDPPPKGADPDLMGLPDAGMEAYPLPSDAADQSNMMGDSARFDGYPEGAGFGPVNSFGAAAGNDYANGYDMQAGDPSANYLINGMYQDGMPGAEGSFQQDGMAPDGAVPAGAEGAPGAGAGASHHDQATVDRMLAEERAEHNEQLKLETRAREELEDMILRIERHFKTEQAARKKAEEMLQASLAAEVESRNKLEEANNKRQQEQRLVEDERAAIKRERNALESMRQEFEAELQTARMEVSKAQEALATSEERIRTAEQLERSRLEVDYQSKLNAAYAEKERIREELSYRTLMMNEEMEKWRQQALLTSTAVMEAKNEVMERKRELEGTKEKMDKLLEKLYIGRERGIELSGAIASNQRMMSFMPGSMLGAAGSLPPMHANPMAVHHTKAAMMSKAPNGGYQAPQPPIPMQAWGPVPGSDNLPGSELSPSAAANNTKLPPIKKQAGVAQQPSMVPMAPSIDEQLAMMDALYMEGGQHEQLWPQEGAALGPKAGGYAQSKVAQNIAEAGKNPKRAAPSKAKKPERNQGPARWN